MATALDDYHSNRIRMTHHSLLCFGLYVPGQCVERLLHINAGLGRRLHELDSVLHGQLFPAFLGHLPLLFQLAFVP